MDSPASTISPPLPQQLLLENNDSSSKTFKLLVHQRNFSDEDILLATRDMPGLQIGDVVEIFDPYESFTRLLIEVRRFREELQLNTISIEASLAAAFHLRAYRDVVVTVVKDRASIELNLIELQFRDFYLSRGDMWQLISTLRGRCVHLNQKVEFLSARFHVLELWAHGRKVACGLISRDTKVVFRSASANCTLFIQLGEESWQSDTVGDLYFEKCMWFLRELFSRWREESTTHDVTIVAFSRVIYDADDYTSFPASVRECLLRDRKGRFYEDFYRIVVQNERYDDWTPQLPKLQRLFSQHRDAVLNFHRPRMLKKNKQALHCRLSSAKTGALLEVLNMAIQLFERHNIDRNFERTGQMCIVVSPGVGVFEVDREMLHISRQRSLDYGIGNDLVFLGEQPLHVVPLYMLYNREGLLTDYYIPNWLNYSYFCGPFLKNGQGYPRVRRITALDTIPSYQSLPPPPPPPIKENLPVNDEASVTAGEAEKRFSFDFQRSSTNRSSRAGGQLTPAEMDAYDNAIFKPIRKNRQHHSSKPTGADGNSYQKTSHKLSAVSLNDDAATNFRTSNEFANDQVNGATARNHAAPFRQVSSNKILRVSSPPPPPPASQSSNVFNGGKATQSPAVLDRLIAALDLDRAAGDSATANNKNKSGSADRQPTAADEMLQLLQDPSKALINPFSPSNIPIIKATPNRRRWVHAFPQNPAGQAMQTHHTERRQDSLTGGVPENGRLSAATKSMLANSLSNIPAGLFPQYSPLYGRPPRRQSFSPTAYALRNSLSGDASYAALTRGQLPLSVISDTEDSDAFSTDTVVMQQRQPLRPSTLAAREYAGTSQPASRQFYTQNVSTPSNIASDDDAASTVVTARAGLNLSLPHSRSTLTSPGVKQPQQPRPNFGIMPRSRAVKSMSVVPTNNNRSNFADAGPTQRTVSVTNAALQKDECSKPPATKAAAASKKFAWGITGEQKWTPHTITTVDWKSLTVPACLPVTTDYLPDDKTLLEDFQINEYNVMLDEDKPLTLAQLYKELINQRLQASFQLITRESGGTAAVTLPSKAVDGNFLRHSVSGLIDSQNVSSPTPSLVDDVCYLSFGAIYHRLAKDDVNNQVQVTMYTPRHRTKCPQRAYRYRFHVPDAETYAVSSVIFSHERVEYWNHVDMCVSGLGRGDMPLDMKMKYWRTYLAILPCNASAIKAISDGTAKHCDIFMQKNADEIDALCDGFLRLLEAVNRVRRPVTTRRGAAHRRAAAAAANGTNTTSTSLRPPLIARATSLSVGSPMVANNLGLHAVQQQQQQPRLPEGGGETSPPGVANDSLSNSATGSAVGLPRVTTLADLRRGSEAAHLAAAVQAQPSNGLSSAQQQTSRAALLAAATASAQRPTTNNVRASGDAAAVSGSTLAPLKLSHNSPSTDILRAMMLPAEGVNISSRNADFLPPACFISADAIEWATHNVVGCSYVEQAAEIFELMLEKKLIWPLQVNNNEQQQQQQQQQQQSVQRSDELQNAFVYGFYLYCCSPSVLTTIESSAAKEAGPPPLVVQPQFASNDDWVQVAIINPAKSISTVTDDEFAEGRNSSASEYQMLLSSKSPRFEKLDNIHNTYRSCYALNKFRDAVVDPVSHAQQQQQADIINHRHDRTEWISVRYFSTYHPQCVYEIELRWLVASGLTLGETLATWCRKAPACGFHIVPIPHDPFALPSDVDADPLRGPLFIPIEFGTLSEEHEIFRVSSGRKAEQQTNDMRIVLFLETVAKAFGFLHCQSNNNNEDSTTASLVRRYVHCSGGMFLMIRELPKPAEAPNAVCWHFERTTKTKTAGTPRGGGGGKPPKKLGKVEFVAQEKVDGDDDESDSSQLSFSSSTAENASSSSTGYAFVWAWNSLLTRRYKSSFSGEEAFLDTMLQDFRNFCRNQDDRVVKFFRQHVERQAEQPVS